MNSSVYIFGNLGNGYTQFPDDYTKIIFREFLPVKQANSQIIVHRDNNLMYYGYYRKLDTNSQYIGLCILLNGIMLTQIKTLFSIFEDAVADMVTQGEIIQFNEKGQLISNTKSLISKHDEIQRLLSVISYKITELESSAKKLPPVKYGISKEQKEVCSLTDNENVIIDNSHKFAYTYIIKNEDYEAKAISKYRAMFQRLNNDNENLKKECSELKRKNHELNNKQRNTKWVGGLLVTVAVLSIILYFKVINPSEVTKYKTKEFVYYGPIKNGQPHGIGVAIYPDDDKDKRKYYYGNFVNGIRKDTAAMLYYQNGNYFYGEIDNTHFVRGIQYVNSSNSYFRGYFDDNSKPFNGIWYDYEEAYSVVSGK